MDTQQFVIDRDHDVALRFQGELLADADSKDSDDLQRWTQIRIYKAASGKYIAHIIGHTIVAGEFVRSNAYVCADPAEVVEKLRRRGELTYVAKDALELAAESDPSFVGALIQDV